MASAIAERFWSKADVRGPDECWPWQNSTNEQGYGIFTVRTGRKSRAHRVAYELTHGVALMPDVKILHRCDNPPCVNPAHLRAGTQAENMADMVAKGRQRSIRHSRLPASHFDEITAAVQSGAKQRDVARRFGVSQPYVSRIAAGKRGRREKVA